MKERRLKGSYTLEAAIYIPMIMFLLFGSLDLGIQYWQRSKEREISQELQELNILQEFYRYQILEEAGKELNNGES